MSQVAGMGLSTLIAIERGSANVAISHWIRAMEALNLHSGFDSLGSLGSDPQATQALMSLVPKRASSRMKKAHKS